MRDALRRFAASTLPAWTLAGAAVVLLVATWSHRLPFDELRGDEGTYVAMTASLARELDLEFDAGDATWAAGHPGGDVAVILQRTATGIFYSKPILYPIVAAPFHALGGERGMVVGNVLLLALAFAFARAFLGRLGEPTRATETALAFLFAAAVVPYVAWRMAEALEVALATVGLALALAHERGAGRPTRGPFERLLDSPRAPVLGALLLGLLVALREPHAAVAAVPVLAALAARQPGRAARVAGGVLAAYLAVVVLTWAVAGAPNAYKAERATFNGETGYPAGPGAEGALRRFGTDEAWARSMIGLRPDWQPTTSTYAALYFFVGRHSGLLLYFPAGLVLLGAALRRPDRVTWAALAGFGGLVVFYLVWWPTNYFGGETFVGNRYLLPAYPCLIFALTRLPSRRALFAAWAMAAVVGVSALLSVIRAGGLDETSQSHAHAGIFRLFPYESIATGIDGRRDRYWSEDFQRFVDPWARADRSSFELDSTRPPAEIELAATWEGDPTTWLVVADAPDATLVVSDWRRTRRYELAGLGERAGGPVLVDVAPAWRIHEFWWSEGADARARALRFSIETPDGREAKARVRYLGRRAIPSDFAARHEIEALPTSVVAGSTTTLTLKLINDGSWTWRSDDVLPVQLGVRWLPFEGGAAVEHRFELARKVTPGEALEQRIAIESPPNPGRWRLVVDLVLEDVAWFADRTGRPIANVEIQVLSF